MVQWEDGTHEILIYNDDNGYGLTGCERRIGPWDVWLVGVVTCADCARMNERREAEARQPKKGPKEWFPPAPAPKE